MPSLAIPYVSRAIAETHVISALVDKRARIDGEIQIRRYQIHPARDRTGAYRRGNPHVPPELRYFQDRNETEHKARQDWYSATRMWACNALS